MVKNARLTRSRVHGAIVVSTAAFMTCAVIASVQACTREASPTREEPLGETSEALMPADANYSATGTSQQTQASVAFTEGCKAGPQQGQWVIGLNSGNQPSGAAVSYSQGGAGTAWVNYAIDGGYGWGNPGNSPYNDAGFAGLYSDPAVAAVTDPSTNNGSTRVLYAMVNISGSSGGYGADDVVVYKSDDCGVTWGDPKYVTTHTSGGSTDFPSMASSLASPYHTFASWTSFTPGEAWIRQIEYSPDGGFDGGTPAQIPSPSDAGFPLYVDVSVGVVPNCGDAGGLHEGVYVSFTMGGFNYAGDGERCAFTSNTHLTESQSWYVAVYDTYWGIWSAPFRVDSDSTSPICVGYPIGATSADNIPTVRVAASTTQPHVYTTYIKSSGWGTRMYAADTSFICDGGVPAANPWNIVPTPDPCDPTGLGQCQVGDGGTGTGGVDGGRIIQDEWGAEIAYGPGVGKGTVLYTWYDTRNDVANRNVNMYMRTNASGTISAPQIITIKTPGSTEVVPWDHNLSQPWGDHQGLAYDSTDKAFLAAWGADTRLIPDGGPAGTWTSYIH